MDIPPYPWIRAKTIFPRLMKVAPPALQKLLAALSDPNSNLEIIKELLTTEDVNNINDHLPLHVALLNTNCKPEIIRLLLLHGASVNAKNCLRETSLHVALRNSCRLDVIQILLENNASVIMRGINLDTPLHIAASNPGYDIRVIKALLHKRASLRIRNCLGDTPLQSALKNMNCRTDIVKLLLPDRVLNDFIIINNVNSRGITPLQTYILNPNCKVEVVRELFDHGADITLRNGYHNKTLLHSVVKKPNCYAVLFEILKISTTKPVNEQIDINAVDEDLNTPLHVASGVDNSDEKVISLLLEHGSNLHFRNKKNETPLHKAVELFNYNLEVIQTMLEHGAAICESNIPGFSSLKCVVSKYASDTEHYRSCAELLLKYAVKFIFKEHECIEPNFQGYNLDITLCPDLKYTEYGDLSKFIDRCCHELVRMKTDMLTNDLSLYDVISHSNCRMCDDVNNNILTVLRYNSYPIYSNIIVKQLDRSELLTKLHEQQIYTKCVSEMNGGVKERQVVLVFECLDNIAKHLNKLDLLNLIIAYYQPIHCSPGGRDEHAKRQNAEDPVCKGVKHMRV